MKKILIMLFTAFALTGCSKASRVNHNIREDANNFKITRKVVALNTRTNDPLFTVEGKISLDSDEDGDLNVTIKTGKDKYKLFYAHLSNDVTYTCIQTKKLKKKILMPMTFNSFQQKKLLKMVLLISNQVSRW